MRSRYSDFSRGVYWASAIDGVSRGLGEAHLRVAVHAEADAGRLAVGVDDGDVRQVNRRFLVDDPALRVRLRGTGVALDHVDPRHDAAAFGRQDAGDVAGAALVLARQNDHAIALLDLRGHQMTSGARETIFMWFLARSSRGTGPKIRVPTGSFCLLTMTAALLSKRMTEPSLRWMSLAVRTTMARSTSPFFTRPRGMASLTETTITSPTEA